MNTPSSVRHARAAFAASGLHVPEDNELGALLRGLTASKLGTIVFVSGSRGCDVAGWMIDGMDISCRLLVHYESEIDSRLITGAFNNDLRVTTHEQTLVEFLDDVARHRFGIFVLAPPVLSQETLERSISAVDDGGFLVILDDPQMVDVASPKLVDFALVHRSDSAVILVRRHPGNQPRRRGGRRRERAGSTAAA